MRSCDLCESPRSRPAVRFSSRRALRSDGLIVPTALEKDECAECGLVRSTGEFEAASPGLNDREYRGATSRGYSFYTPSGTVPRSTVLADWMMALAGEEFLAASRLFEIGADDGELLGAVQKRTGKRPGGFELHEHRAAAARRAGYDVTSDPRQIPEADLDLIWSIAVLEHVASPSRFLSDLRRRLATRGTLVLAVPIQDVPSTDLVFIDHLWHFHTAHMCAFAEKCGFDVLRTVVGHPLMPNFSLHVWRATESGRPARVSVKPVGARSVAATIAALEHDCRTLDAHLAEARAQGRRIAAFGLDEVFQIARCYTSLGDAPLSCGLVDDPGRPEYREYGLPVLTPEELSTLAIEDVILTANPHYYQRMSDRIRALGARPVPFLTAFGMLAGSAESL